MTASHILYRLSRCLNTERVRDSGTWITVSVPAELWQAIMDKAKSGKKD